jgi:hypothetical protein
MQKTSVMLLQTTDSAIDDRLPCSYASFRHPRSSTSASPVIIAERKLARLWLHRLPITLRRQARNPAPSNYDSTRWPVLSKVWFLPTTTGNSSCAQQTMWFAPQTSSAPTYHVLPSTHVNLRKSCMFVLLNVVGVTIASMDTSEARHGIKTPATDCTTSC